MNTIRERTILGVCVALALAAGSASATNGYYTHGAGTKSKGQAGAGSANPEELMILATNPAGLTQIPESIDAGLSIFSPRREYSTSQSQANGACIPDMGCAFTIGPNDISSENEYFPIPFFAMNWHLTDVDYLGTAFYARGGMNTEWQGGSASFDPDGAQGPAGPMTFPGTYGDGTSGVDLMQGFLNLSYARKLNEQFSVGASAIFAIQRFEARGVATFAPYTKTYVESYFTTGQPKMPEDLSSNGHDMSYGYGATVGLEWQPSDKFGFAAAYTTKMSMSEFSDYSDLFAEAGGFDMPSTWTVGVAFRPTDRITFVFDVQGINFSDVASVSNRIERLYGSPTDPTVPRCPIYGGPGITTSFENCLGGDEGPGFGWDDMTVYKLGGSWRYSDAWTFRAGYSTTDQPIPSDQMSFNILAPGVMEQHFTVGFTRKQASGNELNFSFMYAPEETVTGPNNFDPSQTVEFSMHQFELEVSYSWKR